MPQSVFQFTSSGFSTVIQEYEQLGKSQKDLDALVRTLARAFESQGLSTKAAITAAKELAASNGITADSIQKLNDRNKELKTQAEAVADSVRKQIAAEKELERANQSVEKAAQQLGFTLKGNIDAFNKLDTAFNNDTVAANNAVKAYERLKSEGASTGQIQQTLASQLGVTGGQFAVLDESVKKAGVTATQTNQALLAMAGSVSGAIGAAFAKGTKDFIDFDNAIKRVGITTKTTGTPELAALRGEVERLGIATSKTPTEISGLAVALSKTSLTAPEVTKALQGVTLASEASGENIQRTGSVIAASLTQFNLGADQTTRVADLLVAVTNNADTSIDSLGEAFKVAGADAAASNQSIESTTTALGLLAGAGIQGSAAGTAVKTVLDRLKIASSATGTELTGLVKGSAQQVEAFKLLQTEIRGTDGQLKQLPEIIGLLREKFKDLTPQDRDVLARALFGEGEGANGFLAIINQSTEKVDRMSDAVKNAAGTTEKAGATMKEGLGGAVNLLEGSVGALSNKLGAELAPALEGIIKAATAVINGFLGMDPALQKIAIGVVGLAGVLTAATAVLAAYNIAVEAGVIAASESAIAVVASVPGVIAKTGAMVALTVSEIAATLATEGFAAASVAASTALAPLVATIGTALAGALTACLPLLIAVGAAFAILKTFEALKFEGTNNAIDQMGKTAVKSGEEFATLGAKLKALNDLTKDGAKLTEAQVEAGKKLIEASKEKKKALEDEIEANNKSKSGNEEQDKQIDVVNKGIEIQIKALDKQSEALSKSIESNNQHSLSMGGSTKKSKELTEALKEEETQLKRTAAAAKEKAKEAFDDNEKAIKRKDEDQKEVRKGNEEDKILGIQGKAQAQEKETRLKLEEETKAVQQQNQQELDQKKKDFEQNEISPLKKQLDEELRVASKGFESEQSREKKQFELGLQQEKKQFELGLRQEEARFNKEQQAEKKAFEKSIKAEEKGVDRQLQLADPANAGKTGELVNKFKIEDALAARREQLEAPIRTKKEAFEKKQQAEKEAREELIAKKKEAKDAELEAKKEKKEDELNKKKADFENTVLIPLRLKNEEIINQKKVNFENTVIAPLKAQQENQLLEKKKVNEGILNEQKKKIEEEIKAIKKKFNDDEKAITRKEEDQKVARERKFKEEERKKEEDLQDKIQKIKSTGDEKQTEAAKTQKDAAEKQLEAARIQARSTATPRRETGGSVQAGQAYLVGEREAELFVPGVSGTILNQEQIKNNLMNFKGSEGIGLMQSPGEPKDNGAVVRELQQLKGLIASRNPSITIPTTISNAQSKDDYEEFLSLQKTMIRGLL